MPYTVNWDPRGRVWGPWEEGGRLSMGDKYEIVHSMTDFWDGPRQGIANFNGIPHLYESEFDKFTENDWQDTYLLMPIDEATFQLAMEDWEIWRRWETAFHSGM